MRPILVLSIAILALSGVSQALVTINLDVGGMRNESGVVISDTLTLWALVHDDGDGVMIPTG